MDSSLKALEGGYDDKALDDDGRAKRTGTMWTASAHIITAVIGSGVLSLGWSVAQIGWIAGPIVLILCSAIIWLTSILLCDCYRTPDPVHGKRNSTYMEAVRANLGGYKVKLCAVAQYTNLAVMTIGFTITGSISMAAVQRSGCFHEKGHAAKCSASNYSNVAIFGVIQIILSQIPNFHKLSWLSAVSALMAFVYSSIGIGLSIARAVGGGHDVRMGLTGVTVGVDVTNAEKFWRIFQAVGDIAAAYTFSAVMFDIQDTLKSSPPENQVMKKAASIGVCTTTAFYLLCGCLGYVAFGNDAPGNMLTGFGFYEPFWLIDIGNIGIAINLIGSYQVFCQPIYRAVEIRCASRWPESGFVSKDYLIKIPFCGEYPINGLRLIWRTTYVIITAIVAMIFPFFNAFLGLVGAVSFWPLAVYFPTEMHMKRTNVQRFSKTWIRWQTLSVGCLLLSIVSAVGSIAGLLNAVKDYKPFKN